MANPVRYIHPRRNGVFYYERRVPDRVQKQSHGWKRHFGGRKLFRVSLRTKSQPEALAASETVHDDFERRVLLALGQTPSPKPVIIKPARPITRKLVTKITDSTYQRVVRPWQKATVRTELGHDDQAELERLIDQRESDAEQLREVLIEQGATDDLRLPDISGEVARLIEDENLDAPPGSNMYAILMRAVREGHLRAQREIDKVLSGQSSAIPLDEPSSRKRNAPKLSEVLETYVEQLRAPRTIREAKEAFESLIEVTSDLPLDELTRRDVIEFCKEQGTRIIGGKTPGSVSRPLSPSTLKKKISLIRAAINHAIKAETFEGPNPATEIDARVFTKPVPRASMPAKRPFTVDELQRLLAHPWFTGCRSKERIHQPGDYRLDGMHYWVPILAMFTGCRAGELGGLRIGEVRLDNQHPHIVIQDNLYRSTKGAYRRNVPVLDALFKLGFDRFVERVRHAGHDRLFHDWKPPAGRVEAGATAWSNASLIRTFNRTVIPQQLGEILATGVRQEVTFHSFRGAFKTLLGRSEYNLPDNYKHEVIGHAKSALDKRYVQEIPLADTYPAVRASAYQGLVLPVGP